ncbi:hypothetical protein HPB50_004089 [Hyalomma asiaticum]|uniref:Uncharacterized protein n=1 Tax=Hyalomma asiaticum TaxID=266040 RepID=A0ACB7TBP8_HYAAI|nr:hypothetical protein HPB50_004089 [Hyalomma asiaticum]
MLPENLVYRTARGFSSHTGSGIGERLRLTEQGMTGRGYAISCMVATRRTIRPNPMATQRDPKGMWRPRARNPWAKEASVRSGNRSRGGGLPRGESVHRAERWWYRKPTSTDVLGLLAEAEAMRFPAWWPPIAKSETTSVATPRESLPVDASRKKPTYRRRREPRGGDSSGGGGNRPFRCFKCKQEGHIAKDRSDQPVPRVGPDGKPMEAPYMPTAFSPHRRRYSLLECLYRHKLWQV